MSSTLDHAGESSLALRDVDAAGAGGRERLLLAARYELAEVGVGAVSLRSIARRAGVSHAAPKHHFGDRAGLFTALATEGFGHLATSLRQAASQGLRGQDLLSALGRTYLGCALEQPALFDLMIRPELVRDDDAQLQAAQRDAYAVLGEAVGGGPVRSAGNADRTNIAWAFIHGLAVLVRTGALARATRDDPRVLDEIADDLIRHFSADLLRRPKRRGPGMTSEKGPR
ncbi:MAG: TetR/AcrR family transcriptional regulator [Nocardioides sp.]|uniref:TetR/AcrR family transcriptional regulator n=1 Tax=Nocardioides sp. TaxID=35761 RepID=UPI0039E41589